LIGEPISPFKMILSRFSSSDGIADKSAWVYGCAGCLNISSLEANSTICPMYMTPT
jgi:rRNA maturation endonuclease Nob1